MLGRMFAMFVLVALGLSAAGCVASQSVVQYATVKMDLKGKPVTLDVADDQASQSFGLMKRTHLDSDRGMVLVFDRAGDYPIWTKNVWLNLDVIWVGANHRVLYVTTMNAGEAVPQGSDQPAQYVIEVNAGVAKAVGLKRGDLVEIPDEINKTAATAGRGGEGPGPRGGGPVAGSGFGGRGGPAGGGGPGRGPGR